MMWSVVSSTSCPSRFFSSNDHLKTTIIQRLHHHKLPKSTKPWTPECLNFCFSQRWVHFYRAAEYKFPAPIPEFAQTTDKFRSYLQKKLGKMEDLVGDSLKEVLGVCTEIFSTFMHTEYGGPGTLLGIPFIEMADTLRFAR